MEASCETLYSCLWGRGFDTFQVVASHQPIAESRNAESLQRVDTGGGHTARKGLHLGFSNCNAYRDRAGNSTVR